MTLNDKLSDIVTEHGMKLSIRIIRALSRNNRTLTDNHRHLARANIDTLGDLTRLNLYDLQHIRGIGEKSIVEILSFLSDIDLEELYDTKATDSTH